VLAGRGDLRFALTDSLDGDLFFDAGNLWSKASLFNPTKLRYSAGFGVSYPLPIGPAAIDLAFNLAPDTNVGESIAQVHFAIGL
jgi:outer membrane translocation and assembly module TamA